VVAQGGRSIAVLGLEDVVVVDTGDALLVTDRAHAQDVKSVVEALKRAGHAELT
jgi:mannose-1-phosphate guanylyltransferase